MKLDDADQVDQICYQMKLADYARAKNRTLINNLMNGLPPLTEEQARENNINVNVNFLEGTHLGHQGRSQFYAAFLKQNNYFRAITDAGPDHKNGEWSSRATSIVNRIMKRSIRYYEGQRSKFALLVLHGISPSVWEDQHVWCPDVVGIEDVMVPSQTLLTMKNLPLIAIYRSFTAQELIKLTNRDRNPGWNMPLVRSCIRWLNEQALNLMGTTYPEVWSPEKIAERVKQDTGFYMGDQAPTLNAWDVYFWDDSGKVEGWRRRMILDAWSTPISPGAQPTRRTEEVFRTGRDEFLFNARDRKVADSVSQLAAFQFADLSAVAPFRYHSVRSFGFLVYSVCHLQNRLRSRFTESVFEALMQLFRVKGQQDVQRALRVDLVNRGFVDENIAFIPATERYYADHQLVQLGLQQNANILQQHSGDYTANPFSGPTNRTEKTRFEVMAELNSMTALLGAALTQAYRYQEFEYREIFRRFMQPKSRCADVLTFRAECIRSGIPVKYLSPECWDVQPERIVGQGNKTMELAIAQQLMDWRPMFDPESQRQILHDVTLALTDDPGRANSLVPEKPQAVTDSVHDAQLAAGALMQGMPVGIKTGMNHIEYVETLMTSLAIQVQKAQQRGGVPDEDEITGMQNIAQHIAQHIQIIAQDKNEKQRATQYGKELGQLMNFIKAFAQRRAEKMKAGNGNGGPDPETMAKIQGQQMQAQAKMENTRESHAQRTVQRQLQFEQQMQQDAEKHKLEMAKEAQAIQMEHHKNRISDIESRLEEIERRREQAREE